MTSIKSSTTEQLTSIKTLVGAVVLVAGAADANVVLNDSSGGGGTDKIELKALANDSKPVVYSGNGVEFNTGIYSTLTGTGAKVYVYVR